MGQIRIGFIVDECPYVLWMRGAEPDWDGGDEGRGFYVEEAMEYAERF